MGCFRKISYGLILVALALACAAAFAQQDHFPALRIAGNMTTIELAPVLVAANGVYPGPVTPVATGDPLA